MENEEDFNRQVKRKWKAYDTVTNKLAVVFLLYSSGNHTGFGSLGPLSAKGLLTGLTDKEAYSSKP
jgi:hypothetical protein